MTTARIKTDNSFLRDKIDLRIAHLPRGKVKVLDCYAGKGMIWKAVKKLSGREIVTVPIDVRSDIEGFHLHGDNLSFLRSLDLSRFDVIDLDAYGVPYEQLDAIFRRKFKGTVYATFIQSGMGQIPHALLRDLGFTDAMISKTPILLSRRGWEYFQQFLAVRGVVRIHHRSSGLKHYLAFAI